MSVTPSPDPLEVLTRFIHNPRPTQHEAGDALAALAALTTRLEAAEMAADPQAIEGIFDALGKPRESNIYNVPAYIRRLTTLREQMDREIANLRYAAERAHVEYEEQRTRLEQAEGALRAIVKLYDNAEHIRDRSASYRIATAALSPTGEPTKDEHRPGGLLNSTTLPDPEPTKDDRCPTCESDEPDLELWPCTIRRNPDPWHTKEKT